MRILALGGRPLVAAAALGATLAACGRDGPADPSPASALPRTFYVFGEAQGEDPITGRTAHCQFDLVVELKGDARRSGGAVEYLATHGGSMGRTVLESDGSGLSLWAEVFGPETVVRLLPDHRVQLVLFDRERAEGRFWKEVSILDGTRDESDMGSGVWTCAPFDINHGGYVDTAMVAHGTWRMQRQP